MNACRRIQALPVRRGFTLVELLVVIVIIAAVLIGVITRVQQFAQASTRLSNMRQAGSLLLGIAAERNGPCSYFSGGNGNFAYRPYVFGYQALDLSVHSVWGGRCRVNGATCPESQTLNGISRVRIPGLLLA